MESTTQKRMSISGSLTDGLVAKKREKIIIDTDPGIGKVLHLFKVVLFRIFEQFFCFLESGVQFS